MAKVVLGASVAGMIIAAVGAILYKLFGTSAVAAVLAMACGVVRAAWRPYMSMINQFRR